VTPFVLSFWVCVLELIVEPHFDHVAKKPPAETGGLF
jgi:hypothetical protein